VLQNLRRICSSGALLEVVIGLDLERDQSEIERLGLTPLSLEFIDNELIPKYAGRDSKPSNAEFSPRPKGPN
jgi:hypothetical protein